MSLFLDCSGLACPQPVLTTKRAVESESPRRLQVLVDNQAALENVSRFLSSNGYAPLSISQEGKWLITADRVEKDKDTTRPAVKTSQSKGEAPQALSPKAMGESGDEPGDGLGDSLGGRPGYKSDDTLGDTPNDKSGNTLGDNLDETKTLVLMLSPTMGPSTGTGDGDLGSRLMKNFLATLPEMGDDLWRIVMLNGAVTLATQDSHVITELQALEASGVDILVCGTCLEYFEIMAQKAVGQTTNMLDVVTSLQLADKVIRV